MFLDIFASLTGKDKQNIHLLEQPRPLAGWFLLKHPHYILERFHQLSHILSFSFKFSIYEIVASWKAIVRMSMPRRAALAVCRRHEAKSQGPRTRSLLEVGAQRAPKTSSNLYIYGSVSPGRGKCLLNVKCRRLVWLNQTILTTSVDLWSLIMTFSF